METGVRQRESTNLPNPVDFAFFSTVFKSFASDGGALLF